MHNPELVPNNENHQNIYDSKNVGPLGQIDNLNTKATGSYLDNIIKETMNQRSHLTVIYLSSIIDVDLTIEVESIQSGLWNSLKPSFSDEFDTFPFRIEDLTPGFEISQDLFRKDTSALEKMTIRRLLTPFEKGEMVFQNELAIFLSSGLEGQYAAYIGGICVATGSDDVDLFFEVLKRFDHPPDFVGYIGKDGIEKVVYSGSI
jgi:hypothetical protein